MVAHVTCTLCEQNHHVTAKDMHALPAPALASHVLLTITWSSSGGVGGCADLCDFAARILSLCAWSPGPISTPASLLTGDISGDAVQLALQDVLRTNGTCASGALRTAILELSSTGAGAALSGAAALGTIVSLEAAPQQSADSRVVVLNTREQTSALGAAVFTRVIDPAVDCPCLLRGTHALLVTAFVKVDGGTWPGEGIALSLVDASRQTPGATRFIRSCGVSAALPAYALSVVLDSASDSEPGCVDDGIGALIVSTFHGDAAPPHVVVSTLPGYEFAATSRFRNGGWVPLQFTLSWLWSPDFDPSPLLDSTGMQALKRMFDAGARPNSIDVVRLEGDEMLLGLAGQSALLRDMADTNVTLSRFYIVASARSPAASAPVDGHAVAGVRVECVRMTRNLDEGGDETGDMWIHSSGFRQPLTPPPASRLKSSPPSPPPSARMQSPTPVERSSVAAIGAAAFALTMLLTLALIALCTCAAHRWRAAAVRPPRTAVYDCAEVVALTPGADDDPSSLLSPQLHFFDAFLSYLRADWRLVDAIQDKLALRGVRAFKDVDGHLAGRPFDEELLRAVAGAMTFAPVVTRENVRRMAALRRDSVADTSLAEWLAALYFTSPGGAVAQGHAVRVRSILPIMAGVHLPEPPDLKSGRWAPLREDPEYATALAQLCNEPAGATSALLDATLRRVMGVPLPAAFAAMSVRAVVLSVLEREEAFELTCTDEQFGLYVNERLGVGRGAADVCNRRRA